MWNYNEFKNISTKYLTLYTSSQMKVSGDVAISQQRTKCFQISHEKAEVKLFAHNVFFYFNISYTCFLRVPVLY